MNIFFLDKNPYLCAKYHCTKHNPKMLTEAFQIYSSYLRSKGNTYDFLDKSIPQAKEYVKWLDSHENNLNWFKAFIRAMEYHWVSNTENKNVMNTKLFRKLNMLVNKGLMYDQHHSPADVLPNSVIFRCMDEYAQPDLKNMEECTDLDRVVQNYRDFYNWKSTQMKTEIKFYTYVPYWFLMTNKDVIVSRKILK